jgi:HAD superfamily hydrolase (TIGR01509 family)
VPPLACHGFRRDRADRARESHRAGTILAQMAAELQAPRGLIFDLDGTLVDTVRARIEGWIEALGAARVDATPEQVAPLIGMDGKELARRVARDAGRDLDDDEVEEVDKSAGEAFDRRNTEPRPLPGAHELLRLLDELGTPWLIATSSRAEQVRASINALEIGRAPVIVDGSQVERAKPAPDLLLRAAQWLGLDPSDCWAVGDSTWDMNAAGAAGIPAVGVTAGAAVSASELREAGASLVVETLDEISTRLEGR